MAQMYQELIISLDGGVAADVAQDLYAETGLQELAGSKILNHLKNCVSGAHPNAIKTRTEAVRASGTITFSSIADADTITVGKTVFTAKTSPSGAAQFGVGASDTEAAANAAVKINAHTTTGVRFVASAAAGVLTITALDPGALGNEIPIAISAHGSVSGSGYLTNGTNGTTETIHYFGSGSTF